jgi:hypothetical protein
VRGESTEARRELALGARKDLRHGGLQIVVRDPLRHGAEVSKRPHVTVEEAHLVLPLVEPGEVAARVHEPHHEKMRPAAHAGDVDQHFEEVDLGKLAGTVDERHEDLSPSPLPFRHGRLHQRLADVVAFGDEHLVEPCRGQPLLAARPSRRRLEQLSDSRPDLLPHPTTSRRRFDPLRLRDRQIASHRVARDAHLAGHAPDPQPLDQHLMSDDMHLIHPEHPPADARAVSPGNSATSDPQGWVSFRATKGSISERRDQIFARPRRSRKETGRAPSQAQFWKEFRAGQREAEERSTNTRP